LAAPTSDDFRRAMSRMPTAVTVISASGSDGPAGATANAVTSLSLDPPLMLAALDRGSRTLAAAEAAGRFGINLLHGGQEEMARGFSTKAPHPEKWREVDWEERDGIPALVDSLIWVACRLDEVIAGGDHVILLGEVLSLQARDGDPLVFWRGEYRPLR
jgi:3-hydroxy-9,10-secoandrosta-1,3,5(10)-triene-9,17-dione monooxygenase reductase component